MKTSITLTLVILTFFTALYFGSIKADKAHCLKMQSRAQEYTGFFISQVDNEMCNQLDLPVNALIK